MFANDTNAESTDCNHSVSVPIFDPTAAFMHQSLLAIAELIDRGQLEAAVVRAAQVRTRFPRAAEPARLHGVALLTIGQTDAAIDALQTARTLDPRSVEILCNLGSAWLARHDARAALDALESAQRLDPGHPGVLNGLGNARHALGELAAAHAAYAAAARAAPGYLGAWINLAGIELELQRPAEAERLARSLASQTRHPEAYYLLGQALVAQQRNDEAAAIFAEAERMVPNDARFPYQLGILVEQAKHHAEAAAAHARALAHDPNHHAALAQLVFLKRQLCDWNGLDALSQRLRTALGQGAEGIAPFGFLAEPASAAEQLRCAQLAAKSLLAGRAGAPAFTPQATAADAALRVGFVSNGFGNHPTGLLVVALFECLRRLGIELHLFATAAGDGKIIERRLRAVAHTWHELHGMPARAMAERMHASGVEILFDLRVWGGGHVSEAFALRPAPIQVNWLAYPGTSGAPWIDYVIADRFVLPAHARMQFSEQVAWLPRCFQPSDPTRVVGEPPSRAECGLPASGPVFVCFNNSYKLDPRSCMRMFAVLRAVPDAVLWLLAGPAGADANLRVTAHAHGVDPDRLVFMPKLAHDEYLARYRHADLFLDTALYNAHTTASDAIWAGCPVLTIPGETFAARVAGSLNHHLGLTELNVADDDAFIGMAVNIGRDRVAGDTLHRQLATRRAQSGLFDMQGFAGDFAMLLERIAQRHRAGLPPAPID